MTERSITITAAHDCTNGCEFGSERCQGRDSGGFHGIDSAVINFVVAGAEGAIVFRLFSGWYKRETTERLREMNRDVVGHLLANGLGDLGYHAIKPIRPDSDFENEKCNWTGAGCYYDGSGLRAQDAYDVLVSKGSDGIWEFLEAEYADRFAAEVTA